MLCSCYCLCVLHGRKRVCLMLFSETSYKRTDRRRATRSICWPQWVKFRIAFPQTIYPQLELSEAVNKFLEYNGKNSYHHWVRLLEHWVLRSSLVNMISISTLWNFFALKEMYFFSSQLVIMAAVLWTHFHCEFIDVCLFFKYSAVAAKRFIKFVS